MIFASRAIKFIRWVYLLLFLLFLLLMLYSAVGIIDPGLVILCDGAPETCRSEAMSSTRGLLPYPFILGFVVFGLFKNSQRLLKLSFLGIFLFILYFEYHQWPSLFGIDSLFFLMLTLFTGVCILFNLKKSS